MEKFDIPIDKEIFRKTNAPWNRLMLNVPWSVGSVSQLIELKPFKNKDEWRDFYYEMGAYRLKKMSTLSKELQDILQDEQLIRTDKNKISQLSKQLANINKLNGRTETELKKKGNILFEAVKNSIPDITQDDCFKAVEYRVIGETWNGIVLREKNTVEGLKKKYPNLEFKKTDGAFDFEYAVDFDLYQNEKLICGIQIKPKSYTYDTPYIKKAKDTNRKKNSKYTSEFQAPVFDIISTIKGEIINTAIYREINECL